MKILIIGDSYASDSSKGTWPYYLEKFSHEVVCRGIAGSSNFMSLRLFKQTNDISFDYIIVVLTNHHRIPVVQGYPHLSAFLNNHPRFNTFNTLPDDYKDSLEKYMKYYYDNDLLHWITTSVIKDIIDNIHPHQEIIWIDALLDTELLMIENIFKKGIKVKGKLTDISLEIEIREALGIDPYKFIKELDGDPRPNHLSSTNQYLLSKFVTNIIEKKQAGLELTDDDTNLNKVKWDKDPEKIYAEFRNEFKGIR